MVMYGELKYIRTCHKCHIVMEVPITQLRVNYSQSLSQRWTLMNFVTSTVQVHSEFDMSMWCFFHCANTNKMEEYCLAT